MQLSLRIHENVVKGESVDQVEAFSDVLSGCATRPEDLGDGLRVQD